MTGPGAEEEMMECWTMCETPGCIEYSENGADGICIRCRRKLEKAAKEKAPSQTK
jgi:hypothetical protein